jgi:hypothetical protein
MNIIEDNNQKIELYKTKNIHPSYISGLIDGDGTIFIRKIKDGYQSGIILTQSRTNILQILQYHYGGTIIKPNEKNLNTTNIFNNFGYYDINNKRNSYNLIIRSDEYEYILNDIVSHIILKKEQIDCLSKFINLVNKPDKIDEKEYLYKICSDKNKTKISNNYDITRLNIEYIQGLFDAEGYINISYRIIDNKTRFNKGVYMKITQKNHPQIIKEIHNFLGFGKTDKYIYYVDTFEDCIKLVNLLKNGLIVKYNQIIAFEEYLKTLINKNEKYTDEIHNKRESLFKIINKEKHQIEIYNEDDYENQKEGLKIKIDNKKTEYEKKSKIKMKEFYKKKSESMKGEKHYFYNKELSESHKQKIAISNTQVKRGKKYTDEVIKEIFQLKGKESQKDVSEKYDCNRDIIRRIWCEDMVPSDHPNFGKRDKTDKNPDKTSAQKTSETKKTLSNEIYIEIVLWRKKKLNNEKLNNQLITSPQVSKYLSEKYDIHVSVDIIKNIWCGKTKLHDFNFTDCNNEITYEEYINIITKKK